MLQRTKYIYGTVFTVLATFCWGGGTVLTKFALQNSQDGISFFFVQLISACIFMLVINLRQLKFKGNEIKYAWLGLLEPGLAYSLGILGLYSATASQAVIVQALEGFMIAGISFIIFREKTSLKILLLGCCSVFGVILVSSIDNAFGLLSSGVVWIALGTLVAAFYVVLSSKLVGNNNNPFLLVFWQLVAATLACGVILLFDNSTINFMSDFNPYTIVSGIVTYALSFVLYLYGMKYIPISFSGFLLCLTPVFGVILSLTFLNEKLSLINWIGFAVVIISTFFLAKMASHE